MSPKLGFRESAQSNNNDELPLVDSILLSRYYANTLHIFSNLIYIRIP